MLAGSLLETKFAWPKEEKCTYTEDDAHELEVIDETTYKTEEVTYINGEGYMRS